MSVKKMVIELSGLRRLGIDEIALRKGQEDYVVVLVDLDRHEPIGLVASRKQKEIREVLEGWGSEVLEGIVEVSIDLSGNYKGLVEKVLPNAVVVADRFHVMQLVNKELNKACNRVRRGNELKPESAEKMCIEAALKQSKYAILKPEEKLTEKQKLKLEEVRKASPLLAKMHEQKERFRAIFEERINWLDATFKLGDWLKGAQDNYEESTGTIRRWFGEIVEYFENRTTSGVVEGINNKLKLIKRSGYGFRNFGNFQLRCLMCWHFHTKSA
jgi:transposase